MYVKVHAIADARKESVTKKSDVVFNISVKEPAKNNRANKRIQELLADIFHIPVAQVRILTGHHSPSKVYTIEDRE